MSVRHAERDLSSALSSSSVMTAEIRRDFGLQVFGCDVCQGVCPFNHGELPPSDSRQAARPLGHMTAAAIAALSEEEFDRLASGTPMRRIGYHGLRRNACLALGATSEPGAAKLLERLADDPNHLVAETARWALQRLKAG